MTINPKIFREYDVRAVIPDELDMAGVARIAQATSFYFKPKQVAIGYDARNTSPEIFKLMAEIFKKNGVQVISLGQISTDMMTFASGKFGYDLSIIITASHNPPEYNGFKMATKGANSVSGQKGFYKIRDLALSGKQFSSTDKKGTIEEKNLYQDWIDFCLGFIDLEEIKPLKIAIDAGNGVAGKVFGHNYLLEKLPIEIIPLYFKPDGDFPNHIPNPAKQENLAELKKKVKVEEVDLGVALDGDGDRITFLTEKGEFLPGDITTALLAKNLLAKNPGATVLYNAVCGRIVAETVEKLGGQTKRVKVGYSLIKPEMKKTGAILAGEHSCHYLYKDVYNSEASLLTFLLILELISKANQPFSQIVKQLQKYSQSGEINFEVENKEQVMKKVERKFQGQAKKIDWLDGISIWFDDWWANIRASNTQPLLRLNVEAASQKLLKSKRAEMVELIESLGASLSKD